VHRLRRCERSETERRKRAGEATTMVENREGDTARGSAHRGFARRKRRRLVTRQEREECVIGKAVIAGGKKWQLLLLDCILPRTLNRRIALEVRRGKENSLAERTSYRLVVEKGTVQVSHMRKRNADRPGPWGRLCPVAGGLGPDSRRHHRQEGNHVGRMRCVESGERRRRRKGFETGVHHATDH